MDHRANAGLDLHLDLASDLASGGGVRAGLEAALPGAVRDGVPDGVPCGERLPYDLTPGSPDVSAFPRAAWLAAARRALTAAPNVAFGYGDPRGRIEAREALAGYLARVRGVRT